MRKLTLSPIQACAAIALYVLGLQTIEVLAGPSPSITQDVGVCDPWYPTRCIAPDASGIVPVSISSGTVTATVTANATAAAPSYTEGTANPFSQTLSGNLRVIVGSGSTTTVTQATGTNLHAVLDTTSTTAVTQATASNLNAQVVGAAANGAAVSGNPLGNGCRAATAAPTAVTDGQAIFMLCGAEGKQVFLPYTIKELAVRGTANTTGTGATTIIASAGGSLKNYVTGLQCSNTSATTVTITMSDSASSVFIVPANGGSNISFAIPLATAAATAFTFTSSSGVTTLYCSAQGYTGL